MTKSKQGRKLLTLSVWITDPQPDTSHQATTSIKSLWRKLGDIQELSSKIADDKKRPIKQFYNHGNKHMKKTKPLFAAAEYESDESETGEVFVTQNIPKIKSTEKNKGYIFVSKSLSFLQILTIF